MLYKFKRFLLNWLNEDSGQLVCEKPAPSRRANDQALHFNISPATGGYVLDFGYYDSKTDRHYNHLYVVRDDENFSESISHIITLECLKRRG